jgi:hypothetical protein
MPVDIEALPGGGKFNSEAQSRFPFGDLLTVFPISNHFMDYSPC